MVNILLLVSLIVYHFLLDTMMIQLHLVKYQTIVL